MNEELRTETMELCVTACEKHANSNEVHAWNMINSTCLHHPCCFPISLKEAAKMIKETMDKKFGAPWHAVVGEGFGFEITHEVKNLLYMFFQGNMAICVWKCAWCCDVCVCVLHYQATVLSRNMIKSYVFNENTIIQKTRITRNNHRLCYFCQLPSLET